MNASATPNKYFEVNKVKIPVIYEISNLLPTGYIQLVFIGGGSINDGVMSGLSNVSASLLNEGTKELGVSKFSELLESKAISLSAATGTETLDLSLNFLKKEQTNAIKLLGDLLKSPNLTPSTLQKIQTQFTSALLNKQSDFDYIANTNLSSILFKNTPLANPALGTLKTIQSIKLNDVKKYLQDNLVLNRLVIVMGGDMDIDKTLNELKSILSSLPEGEKSQIHHYEANSNPQEKIVYKDTQQAYVYFGSPFYSKNLQEDSYKAKVAGFILGSSGFGSRLMEEVRVKRGLAYSAYMRLVSGKITNYAIGYLQTALKNQDESIKIVKKVVDDFVKNGATQAELDSAKEFLLGSEPLRNETFSQRLNAKFFNFYLGLPLDFNKTQLEQIKNLSLSDLNAFIKSHPEISKLSFSIVSKKDSKEGK